jgi:hypothetical protein
MAVIAFPTLPEQNISVSDGVFSRVLGRFERPIAPNQVAVSGDGRVFVVYEATGGFGIFGRIVGPDGAMSPEIKIEQGGPQYAPHSASVAAGQNYFVVVYRREGETSIQARIYSIDGRPKFAGPITIARDSKDSSELAPTVAPLWGVDAFAVAWNSGSTESGYRIKYSILYPNTQTASNEVLFGENTATNACVQIVSAGPTMLVKVYQVPSSGDNIRMEMCSINTNLLEGFRSFDPSTTIGFACVSRGWFRRLSGDSRLLHPHLPGFHFIVAWHDLSTQSIVYTIRELKDDPGLPAAVTGWSIQNRYIGQASQFGPASARPCVAVVAFQDLAPPKIIIAWQDAGFSSIRARVFNHDGIPESNEFMLHEHSPGGAPSIMPTDDGDSMPPGRVTKVVSLLGTVQL